MPQPLRIKITWRKFSLLHWQKKEFDDETEAFLDQALGIYVWQGRRLQIGTGIAPIEHMYVGQTR